MNTLALSRVNLTRIILKVSLLAVLTIVFLVIGLASPVPTLAQNPEGFPVFSGQTRILEPSQQAYNPTGEFIFPSIIRAADYFTNPLGTYYLYYAPHENPGGISLAYANSLSGPWTSYSGNPIIRNTWSPHYSNLTHVSSPEAIWIPETGQLHLYYHGENTVTRLATSTNGINFTYHSIVISSTQLPNVTERSYARVFRYKIPAKNNVYTMLMMVNNSSNVRKIYLAWSNNAINWTVQQTPLISPPGGAEGTQLSSANYFPWNGKHYVVYHTDSGDMYATEVGANFDMERHAGIFYNSITGSPDDGKASAPEFYTVGSTMYMFYATGPRLSSKLAFATANLSTGVPTNTPSSSIWNVFEDPMNSSAGWSNVGTGGTVTWANSTVRVVDNSTTTYAAISRNNFTPVIGAYTLEFVLKTNSPGKNEIAVRSASYLTDIWITHGTAGTVADRASSPTKSYTLDTTVNHMYRVVVHSNYTYDLYVDGILRWSGATNKGTGSNIMKFACDSPNLADMTIENAKMKTGATAP